MTSEEARVIAMDELDRTRALNASHEHAESAKRGRLASIILGLCEQLDAVSMPDPYPPPPQGPDDELTTIKKSKAKK